MKGLIEYDFSFYYKKYNINSDNRWSQQAAVIECDRMSCGECTLCCTLLNIPTMKSPAGLTCPACKNSQCSIYKNRPRECRDFSCLWLNNPVLGEELRPDKCGVLFELYREQKTVIAIATNNSWKEGKLHLLISQMLIDGYIVWVSKDGEKNLLLPDGVNEDNAHKLLKDAWRDRVWQHPLIQKT